LSGYYESRARRLGLPRPRAGAVAFAQRFDSGLRVNLMAAPWREKLQRLPLSGDS